jgi:stage III sporulation protein AD
MGAMPFDRVAQVVGLALVATVMLVVLRQYAGAAAAALVLRLAVVAVLVVLALGPLAEVLAALNRLVAMAQVRGLYVALLLKVLGIAYLATLGAEVAQDAGEGALAGKVELVGKIVLLMLAVPVVTAVAALLFKLLPGG